MNFRKKKQNRLLSGMSVKLAAGIFNLDETWLQLCSISFMNLMKLISLSNVIFDVKFQLIYLHASYVNNHHHLRAIVKTTRRFLLEKSDPKLTQILTPTCWELVKKCCCLIVDQEIKCESFEKVSVKEKPNVMKRLKEQIFKKFEKKLTHTENSLRSLYNFSELFNYCFLQLRQRYKYAGYWGKAYIEHDVSICYYIINNRIPIMMKRLSTGELLFVSIKLICPIYQTKFLNVFEEFRSFHNIIANDFHNVTKRKVLFGNLVEFIQSELAFFYLYRIDGASAEQRKEHTRVLHRAKQITDTYTIFQNGFNVSTSYILCLQFIILCRMYPLYTIEIIRHKQRQQNVCKTCLFYAAEHIFTKLPFIYKCVHTCKLVCGSRVLDIFPKRDFNSCNNAQNCYQEQRRIF